MKILTALFLSCSLLGLTVTLAHAGDEPMLAPLPEGFDTMTLSRGPSKMTPGLDPLKDTSDTATILSVVPQNGKGSGARIEWSGEVKAGIVYKNVRTR